MKEIKLTRDKIALVDDEYYDLLSTIRWTANSNNGRWYATSGGSKQARLVMHQMIMGKSSLEIDHIDGNGLNNQRCNLRFSTHNQNMFNRRLNYNNKSGFKGVTSRRDAWRARITFEGRLMHLGDFSTAQKAALAYDRAARELYGEFARCNFPEGV